MERTITRLSLDEFKISFIVVELKALENMFNIPQNLNSMNKSKLVDLMCQFYDITNTSCTRSDSESLKYLAEKCIKGWPIDAVNVAYAQLTFPEAFDEWGTDNLFNGSWSIMTDTEIHFFIKKLYAQPTTIDGHTIQTIIDPHHIFVNNRGRCCSKGMIGMGIKLEAWWDVAKH